MNYLQQEKIDYLLQFYSNEQLISHCGDNETKLNELYEYSQPVEMNIEDLQPVNNGELYLADSPDGWVPIEQWRNKGVKQLYTMVMAHNSSITASHDHLFQKSDDSWVYLRDLVAGDSLITDHGDNFIVSVESAGNDTVYDLAIGHDNHRYYTNGICSHNSGKSLFLQNLALNWVFMGLDVIYISLELSENLVAARLDAMVANVSTKDVFRKIDDVDLKVRMRGKQSGGSLTVKKMPEAGTSANVIRAYLKEYEIQTGKKPGALVIDYLDLMYPNNNKINPSDMFVKDKYVAEEMRALFSEYHVLGCTASQLNRASVEAHEFDHSHIAGGISKINTADNVFGIFTSAAMRERGEYQIQFLKTRSSSAVGQRIELKFDVASLRITDVEEGEQMMQTRDLQSIGKDIKNQIKSSNVNSKGEVKQDNDGGGETTQQKFAIPKPKVGQEIDNPNRVVHDPRKSAGAAANTPSVTQNPPKASAVRANMMDILKRVQRDN
jgi:hypothetical protein